MKYTNRILIIGALLLSFCWAAAGWAEEFKGICNIEFLGTSTLHDFSGKGQSEPFTATLNPADDPADAQGTATVRVMVDTMHTHKKGIDKNMRKMFNSKNYPRIEGTLYNFHPAVLLQKMKVENATTGEVAIDLKIRDISHRLTAMVSDIREDDKQISLHMNFPVSLKDYKLKPASLMGLLKVNDTVKVSVEIILTKSAAKRYLDELRAVHP